jgi:hypothetical protein
MRPAGLRADIDNIIEAAEGLERPREILAEYDVRCTVFVNVGKSIRSIMPLRDLRHTLQNMTGKTSSSNLKTVPISKNLLLKMSKTGNEPAFPTAKKISWKSIAFMLE